jgi:hypothetical protein
MDIVRARSGEEEIVSGPRGRGRAARIAIEQVVSAPALDQVVAGAAEQKVASLPSDQHVVVILARDPRANPPVDLDSIGLIAREYAEARGISHVPPRRATARAVRSLVHTPIAHDHQSASVLDDPLAGDGNGDDDQVLLAR